MIGKDRIVPFVELGKSIEKQLNSADEGFYQAINQSK